MDLVFIHCIPSSTDLATASIKQVSGVRTNTCESLTSRKNITSAFTANIGAGYKVELAITEIRAKLVVENRPYLVVSHTTEVARSLLRNECLKLQVEELFKGRAWVDVAQLAWPLVINHMIANRSIETLATYFGVTLANPDDSSDVCSTLVCIYSNMMRRFRAGLVGEEALREIGGSTLENLRQIIGF